MNVPKVLYPNPSYSVYQANGGQVCYSQAQYANSPVSSSDGLVFDSDLQSQHAKNKIGFLDLLKEVFLNGLLEKFMAGLLIYESYGKIQKGLKLPNSNALKLGLTLLGALGIGELFMKFEEGVENWANNLFNPQNAQQAEDRNPSQWTLSALFAKTISVSVLTLAAIGKKMWFLSEVSSGHEEESGFSKSSKEALNHAVNGYAQAGGLTLKQADNEKLTNSNLLDSFHLAGDHMHELAASHTNPFMKAFGHVNGFLMKRIVGCPSLRGGKPTFGGVAGDVALKMAILVPFGLTVKFLVDQSHKMFGKKDKDSDSYNDDRQRG